MLIKEIKQALMGKTISHYDGWNGSSNYFKIGYIQNDGACVRVFPEKGKGWGVVISKEHIPVLIEKGEYIKNNEIERCSFEVRWRLF